MKIYRRRLPHRDKPSAPVFLTWRLWGSLPRGRAFPTTQISSGKAFLAFDRLLDTARTRPLWLRQPEIASLVEEHLHLLAAEGWWRLESYVIMPNHVHVLCTPQVSLAGLIQRIKGATARRANQLLGRQGAFWHQEYFDRLVRTAEQYGRIRNYIEWNPVRAGLAAAPGEYRWSSANAGR